MWDKPSLAVKKVPYFNSLFDQFGGEGGIRSAGTKKLSGVCVRDTVERLP